MFEILRFEAERRRLSTAVLAVVLPIFAVMMLYLGPQVLVQGGFQDMIDVMPPALRAAFGFEYLDSLGGLLASEYFSIGWILLLGIYAAYAMAGTIAGDEDDDQLDMVIAAPLSRTRLLVEKYLALLVPILLVNLASYLTIAVGVTLIDEPVNLLNLAVVHLYSVPYLLCCGAIGLVLSVTIDGGRTAKRAAVGVILGLWLFESLLAGTALEPLGVFTPMRYFDPPAIVVEGAYDPVSLAVLVAATLVLFAASHRLFVAGDVA